MFLYRFSVLFASLLISLMNDFKMKEDRLKYVSWLEVVHLTNEILVSNIAEVI